MPVIPQYNAAGPAQAQAPTLEQGRSQRLDASGQLAALGNLSRQMSGQTAELGGIPTEFGQGVANGVEQATRNISRFGQAMLDLREKQQEARDYVDIQESQIAMDRLAGDFAIWQEKNPDPRNWEKEWGDRSSKFARQYFEGKELSSKAKQGIDLRMRGFTQRQAINVGVAAVKRDTERGREAMQADYYRAIEANDYESAGRIANYGKDQGWIGEDDAVRMEIGAKDHVESKIIETLQNKKNTALEFGDIDGAREAVKAMPIRDDEKKLELALISGRHEYRKRIEDAEDLISTDPENAIKKLDGKDYKDIRASDRTALKNAASRILSEERIATISGIKEDIKLGGVRTTKELAGRDDFKSLTERERAEVEEFFNVGAQNDISEFMTLQRAVRSYEPGNDPRGFEREQFEAAINLRFEGARAEELSRVLEERMSGEAEPLKPSQRVVSDIFSNIQDRYEAGELGGFHLTGDKINRREGDNGEIFYTVADDSGDYYYPGKGFGSNPSNRVGERNERIIELSERDRIRFEEGKAESGDVYQDIKRKESAFSRFLRVQQEVERKVDAGELIEAGDIEAEVSRLMGSETVGALESRLRRDAEGNEIPGNSYGGLSNGLFPTELNQQIEDLLNATGN